MFLVEDFGIWEFLIFWVYLYAYPLIIFVIFPQKKKLLFKSSSFTS